MVFSSLVFLFYFLPLVLFIYALAPRSARNAVLLVSGLFFYLWGAGEVVLVLMAGITGSWLCGAWIQRARDHGDSRQKSLALALGITLNLGILVYYKYTTFFLTQILTGIHGLAPRLALPAIPQILLPIGVSFITFQAISYLVDVANGRERALAKLVDYAMYIAMFPHSIAGPIVRYHTIAAQIRERPFTWESFCFGSIRFSYGLAKKVLIADPIGVIADYAFKSGADLALPAAWVGVLAFTLQVYFDFSGYSDMAIGLARIFGFTFPENFNRPFAAVSVTDFWRRWHITLSTWFRDYVFIPLGGSRSTPLTTYRNLLIVFLLVGFWHGANWTFICFGLYHGLWMVFERATHRRLPEDFRHPALQRVLTFFVVMLGMVWFRAGNLTHALEYYRSMFSANLGDLGSLLAAIPRLNWIAFVVGISSLFLPGTLSLGRFLDEARSRWVAPLRVAVLTAGFGLVVVFLLSNDFKSFIYFQF
jgi:alginate O-acetyltransferase complex protein AlgI